MLFKPQDLEELPMALCCAFGCSSFTPSDSGPSVPYISNILTSTAIRQHVEAAGELYHLAL